MGRRCWVPLQWGLAALGRGGDAAGGGRCSTGASEGKAWGGRERWWCHVTWLGVNDGPGLAWTCAGGGPWLGCQVRVLWYGGGGGRWWGWRCWCAAGVMEWGGAAWLVLGPGRGAAPCWRARWGPPDLSWSSWPGGWLSEAHLQAPDVGALVCGAHLCGGGFAGSGQVGIPKGRPALWGLHLRGLGGVCRVEECCVESVRCFSLSDEGGVEPAASDSEVGRYLLWRRVRPRFRRRGCCLGGWELWVWEVEVTVVEV